MKNWIERFKKWFQIDEEEVETEEFRRETDAPSSVPIANRNLTIRTATIYPKNKGGRYSSDSRREHPQIEEQGGTQQTRRNEAFRFPLIPDEPKQAESVQEKSARRPVSSSSTSRPSVEPQKQADTQTPNRSVVKREERRPFRPTEVISPVYGRRRPDQSEEETERWKPTALTPSLRHPMSFKETPLEPTSNRTPPAIEHPTEPEHKSASMPVQTGNVERELAPTTEIVAASVPEPEMPTVETKSKTPVAAAPDVRITYVAPPTPIEQASVSAEIVVQSLPITPEPEEEMSTILPAVPEISIVIPEKKEAPAIQPFVPERTVSSPQVLESPLHPAHQETLVYDKPSLALLAAVPDAEPHDTAFVYHQQDVLARTLANFNVNAEVIGAVQGPTVTRYEIQPAPGVKVNKITNLIDDIKLSLAARDIRIEAPIPGRSAVGIEVPNAHSMPVYLRSILETPVFQEPEAPLTVALGVDIGGEPVVVDLAKMPHGLIAGATGSGKSVCINSIIVSLLYKATPQEVRLLLIDPKMVELAPYNRLPHLITPVVTDPKQATAALKWAVQEMDSRYEKLAEAGARDMKRYNELMRRNYPDQPDLVLPSIVIIIDELADLMMVAPGDVEESICRIAQKARACGIHLLVATQRPSVDVITGLIKANIPTRVAFSVSSQTDSRTILDMGGAERLLGRGDMLYSSGSSKPQRLQGPYVSDEEIEMVTEYVRSQGEPQYLFEKEDLNHAVMNENLDELFAEVVRFCVENGQASASLLQRNFQIGYNRAARLIDMMEEKGFISGYTGSSKPRDVFLSRSEYNQLFESGELE
ncbi:S-DNA-T family DNA segregation ATPase FtsK/SpoIIIE [Aneurinibacillus soli]|uniref:DNA translocase SftA n=1 Tax=Aneurinibacillus soli TaxID=1500254 RepID=A0A0U5BMF5_9BACL|nr:DNA translocase FtsK [Aneurinibacillus soli]PYE59904.1 S-DNA-T family DNA segregation ATPase FtsK/SpoIIIE [Aneurinibacillus soli]BAU29374.1 DNA translocase SftA [Aneurinibacillus soli]